MNNYLIILISCFLNFNLLGQQNDSLSAEDLKKQAEQIAAFEKVFKTNDEATPISIKHLRLVFKNHQSLIIGDVSDIGKAQALDSFCKYVEMSPEKSQILPDFLQVIKSLDPPKNYGQIDSWHPRELSRGYCGSIGKLIQTALKIDDKKTFSELYKYFVSKEQYDKIDVLLLQLHKLDNNNFKDFLQKELKDNPSPQLATIIKRQIKKE